MVYFLESDMMITMTGVAPGLHVTRAASMIIAVASYFYVSRALSTVTMDSSMMAVVIPVMVVVMMMMVAVMRTAIMAVGLSLVMSVIYGVVGIIAMAVSSRMVIMGFEMVTAAVVVTLAAAHFGAAGPSMSV